MKKIIATFISALCLAANAGAQNAEQRNIEEKFQALEVAKGANVSLVQCDKTAIEVKTEGCPTSDVETFVKNGTLNVKMKKRTPGSAVKVTLYFKDLKSVSVRRGASVVTDCLFAHKGRFNLHVGAQSEARMDLEVDELHVDGTTCNISLEGKATKQKAIISGTIGHSTYNAKQLVSEDVEIKAIDSDAVVNFTNSLKAESVKATIKYKGDAAKVSKTEKANGTVEAL